MQIDPESLLTALRGARGKGLSLKQLAGHLRLSHHHNQPLRRVLSHLLKEGRASYDGRVYREVHRHPQKDGERRKGAGEPSRGQSRRAPAALVEATRQRREKTSPEAARRPGATVTGVIHLKPEGYGFITPLLGEGGRENDLFVPPQHTSGALDGDIVRARVVRGRDGRLAAEVLEIVEQRRQLVLGIYQARGKAAWVIPHDRNLPGNVVVARHSKARDGEMVKVRLHRDARGTMEGEIVAALGPPGDPRFEILAAAYAEGFADEFDPATLIAAQSVPDHVVPGDISGRRDLRHLPLVTIDGEDARDFDDAVHVSRTSGGYRLVVAIADVAHYVRSAGPLDREALRRATSVYFPGTVLPMLPERLSNGICSLNPDVDRLCMVCDLALDHSGMPLQADIYEAVMRSHARLTYTVVADALRGNPDPQVRPLLHDLKVAHELARKLNEQRMARGSIDFDLPEAKIVLDDQGKVLEIVKRPRNDAHRLIEEFMLAANEGVARFFDVRGLPTVYRIHDQPDRDKLEAFAALARSHGFELPSGEDLTPAVLNEFLERVEGKPAQKALNALLLRAMMQAQYSPENIGHYGLAAPTYLHFTSPIRRYPDLMVHRLLKEHWARGGRPLSEGEREEQEAYLAGVAAQCSERERAAMKAERDVDAFYSALYMQDKVGEKFKAVISGVADFGLFCELEDVFVEGLIPAESLGEATELDKERQRLVVGSTGKSYSIGDEVAVEVVSADPARRRITLALSGESARKTSRWLTPEDLPPTSSSKPRRQGPPAPQPGPRRPPRGSPADRKTRRRETRGGRR
jgi:ribonuclease R